ncbi:right-handed parallel beta-helix repeat-containing protein, partial [Candidatus Micrarchaeota archaeon]|nr:right-handed parallel beta-helix repeat-containing protein [Candidatus Micrarchaeota archaeon]
MSISRRFVLVVLLSLLIGNVSATSVNTCTKISSPGTYELTTHLEGAPIPVPLTKTGCIFINSSDVLFDCKGYNITNNGTAGITYGISTNILYSVDNVTIQNCPSISHYTTGISISAATNSLIINNTAQYGTYGFYLNAYPENITLINNTARHTPYGIDVYLSTNAILINNTVHNATTYGIVVPNSEDTYLINNTVSASNYDIYISASDNTNIINNHIYSASANDFSFAITDAITRSVSISNLIIDNPLGNYENYTNLSLADTTETNSKYVISWTTNSSALPSDYISFEQKFLDISVSWGSPVISSISWHWLDSELGGYDESQFELWRYNGNWANTSATRNTVTNTLTVTNLNPASIYGILQYAPPVPTCPVITSSGVYIQTGNLVGAPNDASEVSGIDWACVKIASSDVVYDCNGYNISNNGTDNSTGIVINGSTQINYTNVTIRNCPGISGYFVGAYIYYSSNDTIQNVTAYNNSQEGFFLYSSTDNNLTNNTAYDNNHGFLLSLDADNNTLIRNTAYNNSEYGIYISTSDENDLINNRAYNNTKSNFFLSISDANFLFNNSAYTSVTQYGFYFSSINNNNILNNTANDNNWYGFNFINSDFNNILNNTAHNNSLTGIRLSTSHNNTLINNTARFNNYGFNLLTSLENNFTNNSAYNNSQNGYYLTVNSDFNNLVENQAFNNSFSGFVLNNCSNNTLFNNLAYNNHDRGFEITSTADENNLINNTAHSHSLYQGILISSSDDNTLINNTAYNNNQGTYVVNSDGTTITNDHYYNNTRSFIVSGTGIVFNLSQVIFDNSLGNFQNYTNLSINDAVASAYSINWTNNPPTYPPDLTSFAQKFVNISIISGSVSIDEIIWHWLDSELGGYDEDLFELWKYDGIWSDTGATLTPGTNSLTLTNLNPTSTYGVLTSTYTGLSSCQDINTPGSYILTTDLTGAPISASPLAGTTCIKISVSDVIFDCDGYNITGSGGTTKAIITVNANNVTVRNCPSLSGYQYGVEVYLTNDSFFINNVMHDNSNYGIRLRNSNATLINNTAYDNTNRNFDIELNCDNTILVNNTAHNSIYGFYSYSDSIDLINNTAYNNTHGFYLFSSSNYNVINNTARNNVQYGFYFSTNFNNNNIINNSAYNNTQIGFYIHYSPNNIFDGNVAWNNSGNGGFFIQGSNDLIFSNNIVYNNVNGFFVDRNFLNISFFNNTAYNNGNGFFLFQTNDSILSNNTAYDNSDGFSISTSDNVTLFNNSAYDNIRSIEIYNATNTNLINNTAYGTLSQAGFYIDSSPNTTLINNTIYSSGYLLYALYINSSNNTNAINTHIYNPSYYDVYLVTNATPTTVYFSDLIIDNPLGNYQNYTNLTINDILEANSAYTIQWSTNSSTLPANYISFAQKFLNISVISGSPSIDNIIWHWLDSELGGYDENYFELWKYNGTWSDTGATLTPGTNTLMLTNLNPASEYGILQNNVATCPVITSGGTYVQTGNLIGAPNSAYPVGGNVCVKIAAPDVIYDCNGYTITNDGTSSAMGIMINASATNVTVRNCPSITQYSYGIYVRSSANNSILNSTTHNNTRGIFFILSDDNNVTNSVAYNNFYSGFEVSTSSYRINFLNNTAYNNSWHGFHLYSSNHTLIDNHAFNNSQHGFFFDSNCAYNIILNNTAYNNSWNGFSFNSNSFYNNLTNNTAYNNSQDGFSFDLNSSYNTLINNTAYNNTNVGFIFTLLSSYNNLTNNTAYDNQAGFIFEANCPYNNLTNNTAYNNPGGFSFETNASNNTLINNEAYGGGFGFRFYRSSNNTLINNLGHDHISQGFTFSESSNNTLINNQGYENGNFGFRFSTSCFNNILTNNTAHDNLAGFYFDPSFSYNNLTNNTAYNHTIGFGFRFSDSSSYNNLLNNTAHHSASGFSFSVNSFNNTLTNSTAYEISGNAFRFTNSLNNTMINTQAYENAYGIDIESSPNITSTNSLIYNNSLYGLYIYNSTNLNISDVHFYNNNEDILFRTDTLTPTPIILSRIILDNPLGNFQNYTNLTINDTVEADSIFTISWESNSYGLPGGHLSFAQKFVNITALAPSPSIDEISWHWLDSELGIYNETDFELWKYSSSWSNTGATLDTGANTLTLTNMNPASGYGIFYGTSDCRDDDGDGVFHSYSPGACGGVLEDCNDADEYIVPPYAGLNLTDAHQTYTLCQGVYYINTTTPNYILISFDEYNITLDCNGTQIINDGQASVINGYKTFMTTKNCVISNCA